MSWQVSIQIYGVVPVEDVEEAVEAEVELDDVPSKLEILPTRVEAIMGVFGLGTKNVCGSATMAAILACTAQP